MKRAADIEDQAVRWLIEIEDDGSPENYARLDAWLNASPRHRAEFLRLSVLWHRAKAIRHLRPMDGTVDPDLLISLRRTSKVTAWMPARRAFLAAATVAAFLLGFGLVLWQPDSDSPQLYSTSVGPAEEFILEDGSSIVLNTASEISVRYTESARDVTLLRGEARFTVARNSDRPFQVHAGTTLVRATGTAFTIRLQPRTRGASVSTEVLVTDGTVEIVRTTDRRPLSLTAGRSAKIDAGTVTVTSVQPAEIDNQLAWIQGLIVFNGDPLSDVVSEFNRYNTRQLRIDDPAIAAMRISGTFVATDVGSFLTALEGLNIRAKRVAVTSDSPIVLGRGTDPATKVTP